MYIEKWGAPLGSGKPVVVGVHGITANSHALKRLATYLGDEVSFIAPDLRGRGRSADLPGPYGIKRHADDVIAVMDECGVDQATLVGHSMGAFVVAMAAERHPDRVQAIVLLDGGVPLPVPDGVDAQAMLDRTLGPTIDRLNYTFDSMDDYIEFWHDHPAMVEIDREYLVEYSSHDVVPGVSPLRSSAVEAAVRQDGGELMVDVDVRSASAQATQPLLLARATRGILNQADPRVPADVAAAFAQGRPNVTVIECADTNHFSIIAHDASLRQIADEVLDLITRIPAAS